MTDQLPSVANFLVAVRFVSTQGRHTPALSEVSQVCSNQVCEIYFSSVLYHNFMKTIILISKLIHACDFINARILINIDF